MLSILTMFVDKNKLGGWVRAGVASALSLLILKYPLAGIALDPTTQASIAGIASTIVVGIWSHYVKS